MSPAYQESAREPAVDGFDVSAANKHRERALIQRAQLLRALRRDPLLRNVDSERVVRVVERALSRGYRQL
jgi:hypothetical protein